MEKRNRDNWVNRSVDIFQTVNGSIDDLHFLWRYSYLRQFMDMVKDGQAEASVEVRAAYSSIDSSTDILNSVDRSVDTWSSHSMQ